MCENKTYLVAANKSNRTVMPFSGYTDRRVSEVVRSREEVSRAAEIF